MFVLRAMSTEANLMNFQTEFQNFQGFINNYYLLQSKEVKLGTLFLIVIIIVFSGDAHAFVTMLANVCSLKAMAALFSFYLLFSLFFEIFLYSKKH